MMGYNKLKNAALVANCERHITKSKSSLLFFRQSYIAAAVALSFTMFTASASINDTAVNLQQNTKNKQVEALDKEKVDKEEAKIVGERISIIGSRLKNPEFASDLPIQILSSETGMLLGAGSTQELIRTSTLLTGSPQSNDQTAVNDIGGSVVNGGNGTNTLSLRGLGANRTLVMLDGRRLSPTGVGGGVSSPNISILPSSIISSVEILKDGASSVYGSDAVAGVVNNKLIGATDQDIFTALVNPTTEGGAEFYQLAGRWSKIFEDGYINIAGQVDRSERLTIGDRDYTDCRDPRISDPNTGERLDITDANGDTTCTSFGTNNRFFFFRGGTGNFFDVNSINGRYAGTYIPDPDGSITGPGQSELRGVIPEFARVNIQNLGITDVNNTFGPGSGDFAGVAASNALQPQTSDIILNSNARNPEDRFSLFISGAYSLSDDSELYAQLLSSRVKTEVNSFRYLFANLGGFHPSNTVAERVRTATDGALFGSVGFNLHRPFVAKNETNYNNAVVGIRGYMPDDLGILSDWSYDVYLQSGISDADYTLNFTRQDRLEAVTGFTDVACDASLINTDLLASGQTAEGLCNGFSIPWLSPRILRDGNFNEQELAFLEGSETGNTTYKQTVFEGNITGDLFEMPAGFVAALLGIHVRHDEIDDSPGANSLASNNHNFSNIQPTRGSSVSREVYAELGVPILRNEFLAKRVNFTASGRYTENNRIDDGEYTYKLGLTWALAEEVKFRYNQGTSYRTPALFELFQGGTDSFGPVDPCQNLDNSQRTIEELSNLRQNCGLLGIGGDFQSTENIRVLNRGNNTGTLRPETSDALNVGVVFQFADLGLSFAADFFEIEINDQILRVGGGAIIQRCLVEQSFDSLDSLNADPFCALLGARNERNELTNVTNGSINIASQITRGIDYTVNYDYQFDNGYMLSFNGQVTQVTKDFFDQDRDIVDPVNDDIDRTLQALRPEFTGNFNLSLRKGDWTAFWNTQYVGSSDQLDLLLNDPDSGFREDGTVQFFGAYRFLDRVKPDTKVETYVQHTFSMRYQMQDDLVFNAGIQNIFDRKPPQVGGSVNRIGTSANGPYDFRGRRIFLRATMTF